MLIRPFRAIPLLLLSLLSLAPAAHAADAPACRYVPVATLPLAVRPTIRARWSTAPSMAGRR